MNKIYIIRPNGKVEIYTCTDRKYEFSGRLIDEKEMREIVLDAVCEGTLVVRNPTFWQRDAMNQIV